MKIILTVCLLFSISSIGAVSKQGAVKAAPKELEKIPKSLFLVKKTRNNAEIGEPQLYPNEAQLKLIIDDAVMEKINSFEK